MAAQRDGVPNKHADIFCKYTHECANTEQIEEGLWSFTDGGSSPSVMGSPTSVVQLILFQKKNRLLETDGGMVGTLYRK